MHGHGRLTGHHRFLLRLQLGQYDGLDAAIQALDGRIEAQIESLDAAEAEAGQATFHALICLLCTIPGVSALAEIGRDMSRFPTAGHRVAWAGLCPGQNESAGKRQSSRLRKGSPWLQTMLVDCAWAAKNQKESGFKAQFQRLRSKRGPQKAICAVAASLLTTIYHRMKDGTEVRDLGGGPFNRRPTEIKAKRLVTQFARFGYDVPLNPIAAAA